MSDFFFECKRKKLEKALEKFGFCVRHGSKHDLAECKSNGGKTTIPRHDNIKREIVDSVAKFVLGKDIDKNKFLDSLR